jgi:hypothetical protein
MNTGLIDEYKFSKSCKKAEIFLTYDDKKRPILYVGNGRKKMLLKRFIADFQYKRFLIECVLCYMYADKKYLKKIHQGYNNIVKFLEKDYDEDII